jgi:ubiquinone/menaquinone biosynthesis C-methylase UbiE
MQPGINDPFTSVLDWDEATAREVAARLELRAAAPDQVRLHAELLRLASLQPGNTAVEIGCGTGPLLVELARAVGPSGRAIGVEPQPVLARFARERLAREGLDSIAEVRTGPAEALDLSDAQADACLAQTVLLHILDGVRERALAEMIRAVRPGGRVLSLDQDMATWIVDHPDRDLTERITLYNARRYPDGWLGRHLPRLFRSAGLVDVHVIGFVDVQTTPESHLYGGAERAAQFAAEAGAISAAEAEQWIDQLRELAAQGAFFASQNYYACVGTRAI